MREPPLASNAISEVYETAHALGIDYHGVVAGTGERVLEEAAEGTVAGLVGPPDALLAVEQTLVHEHFDEVIISTLPERASHWLKRDLPAKVERLGIPVTLVRARTARRPIHATMQFGGP